MNLILDEDGNAEAPSWIYYWLGPPCQYDDTRKDLESFPAGDLGGRELVIPDTKSPQELWTETMPILAIIHRNALRRFETGRDQDLHPFAPMVQGIHVTWMFTSQQFVRMQLEIDDLKARINALEERNNAN